MVDVTVPLPPRTTVAALGAAYVPAGSVKSELWLQAMDTQGRRVHTRYTGNP